MDNKITKSRLKTLLAYDLYKIIIFIVLGILLWSLLFTMLGDSLSEGQKINVYSYNVTVYDSELSGSLLKLDSENNNANSFMSYEIRETSYYNFGSYGSGDGTVNQQITAWSSVGQLDAIFISCASDLKQTLTQDGETEEIKYSVADLYLAYFCDLEDLTEEALNYCATLDFQGLDNFDRSKIENHFISRKKKDNFYRHGLINADMEVDRINKIYTSAKKMQYLLSDENVDIWFISTMEEGTFNFGVDMGKLLKVGASTVTGKTATNLCSYAGASDTEESASNEVVSAEGVLLALFSSAIKDELAYENLAFVVEVIEKYSCLLEGYTA